MIKEKAYIYDVADNLGVVLEKGIKKKVKQNNRYKYKSIYEGMGYR